MSLGLRRGIGTLLVAGFVSGCPLLLDDDFELVDARSDAGGPDGSSGGASGAGGSAGQAGAAGSGSDPCAACEPEQTCCDERCVDLATDEQNCGTCGTRCLGTVCRSECTNDCAQGFLDCDRNITTGCEVDAATDPENCGSCGIRCPLGAICSGGSCACPDGTANCDTSADNGCEADLTRSPSDCGACGTRCGANQICAGGECRCAPGFADCSSAADDGCEVDLSSDRLHCGDCDIECGAGSECVAGECDCLPGLLDCDGMPGCEASASAAATCGGCGTSCVEPTPICTMQTCGTACSGVETACGTSCVDLSTNPSHCGACDTPVGPNQVCFGGTPSCVSQDFAHCSQNPSDGCETDLRSDEAHCGACNAPCKAGAVCNDKTCACAAGTPNDCGDACRQCCDDSQCNDGDPCTVDSCNGGTCGFVAGCSDDHCCAGQGCFECCTNAQCAVGEACSGNRCVPATCPAPEVLCAGACVNLADDEDHCGGCGNACGLGRSCSAQACTPKWVPTAAAPPGFRARSRAASAVAGTKLFIWGGQDATNPLGDGAFYDVSTNTWSLIGNVGAPSPRVLASAVWTGSAVVVWGGGDTGTASYATGGVYDPGSNSWRPTTTLNAPPARRAAHAVWTGSRVLIWGGTGISDGKAYLYDPVADQWSDANAGAPAGRAGSATAWSGSSFFVFGGQTSAITAEFWGYAAAAGQWRALPQGPSARRNAFGVWDGGTFLVWGGTQSGLLGLLTQLNDGRRFDPAVSQWAALGGSRAPSARSAVHRQSGWAARIASGKVLVLGGFDDPLLGAASVQKNGAVYDSLQNSWTPVPAWPSGEDHEWAAAAWVGSEFVLWGGVHAGAPTANGERWRP